MPKKGPIDPLTGPKLALRGRVATMSARFRVIDNGVIYIENGSIISVRQAGESPPAGFESVKVVDCGGTIYPGLIELHNHLSYNILPIWQVPRRYDNRDQWSSIPEYQKLVAGPLKVLAAKPDMLSALTRYVEAKCLLSGVTTSQGIGLKSNGGVRRYYRGIVRNVEQAGDPDLPDAATHILDVQAKEAAAFLAKLKREKTEILHLSEGTNAAAHKHFEALKLNGSWALDDGLVGIHCVALTRADFNVLARYKSSMVWSPLSNLLLYGKTADVKAARAAGVRIGIGSDWSVSGSKNLLGELKVARTFSQANGHIFSDRELVAMATIEAAAIIKWDGALGSIENGKRADLLIVAGTSRDPYASLIESQETDIRLVMINGVPRYGMPQLMKRLGGEGESVRIGGQPRMVYLKQDQQDEAVAAVSLAQAKRRLTDALRSLPKLARQVGSHPGGPRRSLRAGPEPLVWSLALDELGGTGVELRPRLALRGETAPTGPSLSLQPGLAAKPVAEIVTSMKLDPLTVADDEHFLDRIGAALNLPTEVKAGIATLY